jgi:putative glutamine amidotransferase
MTIGITTSCVEPPVEEAQQAKIWAYQEMLEDGGARGELLWVPSQNAAESARRACAEQLAERLDGLVLSGGADLPPRMWGEEAAPGAALDLIDPARPAFEALLAPAFLERGKPILGICYGCQFLNVWRGGSLLQDIPTQWPDPIEHRGGVLHPVQVDENSMLHRITGLREFEVASFHHQAIGRVAQTGRVAAWAPDHSPESIEFAGEPFLLGVQWHPERTRESVATQRLVRAFLNPK